ncbi:MAG: ABC transporter permease [Maricaulaceae bacterium]|jgi:phospholipid/cholesterol/gamma-HCH transport system permease protein
MANPLAPVASIGRATIATLAATGSVALFAGRAIAAAAGPPVYLGQLGRQLLRVGYFSLPVVGLTAIFTGASLALNIYTGGVQLNAEQFVPNIVVIGITRELGPVLAALMLAGRVSAGIAAEIGTMRVTEQIDALSTLSTNPYKYLIAPRIVAGVLALPAIVIVADIIGVMGGFVVATQTLGFNGATYVQSTLNFMTTSDVVTGLVKAAVFGFLLTLMGCYHGYTSRGGAQGVGRATTNAVVSSAILIFASNYILTTLFVE